MSLRRPFVFVIALMSIVPHVWGGFSLNCQPQTAANLLRASITKQYTRTNWVGQTQQVGNVIFSPGANACQGTYSTNVNNFLSTSSGTSGNYEVAFTGEYLTPSKGVKLMLIVFISSASGGSSLVAWQDPNGEPHYFGIASDVYEFQTQ